MNILNIDAFAKVTRQVTLAGTSHDVQEPTLQQFIDNLKVAEELESSGVSMSRSQSFERAVVGIKQALPTMEEAEIRSLKLPAMTAILQFIRGDLDPEQAEIDAATSADGAEKKPA